MERKVGEVFTYNGKTYRVAESRMGCTGCAFNYTVCIIHKPFLGSCSYLSRPDATDIIFKLINNNNMEIENNQLTIEVPEGMEIDLKNSNLAKGIIKFKNKDITYGDILQAYATDFGRLAVPNHCIDKLLAISKLMNIAKHYNGDWKPDWNSIGESKYYIYYSHRDKTYGVSGASGNNYGNVYFRLYNDAKAVIDNPNFRDILDAIYKN